MVRVNLVLAAIVAALSLIGGVAPARAAPAQPVVYALLHGAPELTLDACLLPAEQPGHYLFMGFIDNHSEQQQPAYTVALHNADGALLDERAMPTLLAGESRAYSTFLHAAELTGAPGAPAPDARVVGICDDRGGSR